MEDSKVLLARAIVAREFGSMAEAQDLPLSDLFELADAIGYAFDIKTNPTTSEASDRQWAIYRATLLR